MYHQAAFLYDKIAAFEALVPVCEQLHEIFITSGSAFTGRLADCGAGTGLMSLWLAEKGWSVLALDLSAEMLAVAKEKAQTMPAAVRARLTFQQADLSVLALPENSLDGAICMCNTINHLVTPQAVGGFLSGVFSALKPGGVLILDSDTLSTYERFFNHPETVVWEDETKRMTRTCVFHHDTGRADHTALLTDKTTQTTQEERLSLQYHSEAFLHEAFLKTGFVLQDAKPFNPNPVLYAGDFVPKVLWTVRKP